MLFNVTTGCVQVACLLASYFSRSCFELLLSIPESELPHEVWLGFHQSIQVSVLNFFFPIYFVLKKKKRLLLCSSSSTLTLNSTCPALLLSRQQEFLSSKRLTATTVLAALGPTADSQLHNQWQRQQENRSKSNGLCERLS